MKATLKKIKARSAKLKPETCEMMARFVGLRAIELPKLKLGEIYLIRVDIGLENKRWLVAVYAFNGRFYLDRSDEETNRKDAGEATSYPLPDVEEIYALPEVKK